MRRLGKLRALALGTLLALGAGACTNIGDDSSNITDVQHTDVERQSIGNCWLYAQASWLESMHLQATGDSFDVAQSYWTYWHWYGEVVSGWSDEISTGGNQWTSNRIVLERGFMAETDFVPEDATSEMSNRQKTALTKMNAELKDGRLSSREARRDRKLVREVLDEAWGLSDEVREQLNQVFGEDGTTTLKSSSADVSGTDILPAQDFEVRYTRRDSATGEVETVDTTADVAIDEWQTASYPSSAWESNVAERRRSFLQRIQRALHDGQPVVVTWNVDFNAMENGDGPMRGSFNLGTLDTAGGPGRQGGHMTVFEDYEAMTEEYGLLKAGVTLDPEDDEDAAKLEAALLPSTEIVFFRVKNSWGAFRDDRAFAPGFPGYHDLYMDYLNGPIQWCPSVKEKTDSNCNGTSVPLRDVMLPPGY